MLNKTLIFLILINISCNPTKKIQFGLYNYVGLGGLYGETLELRADSTFKFKTSTCITGTLAGGKFTQKQNRIFFYDYQNLLSPILIDSFIRIDTQYLNFPSGRKQIISNPKTVYTFLGNGELSDRIPNNIKIKGNEIQMYDINNDKSGVLKFFSDDTLRR